MTLAGKLWGQLITKGPLNKKLFRSIQSLRCASATTSHSHDSHEASLEYLQDKHSGIAVIGLNRQNARNALGKTLVHQLCRHIETVSSDKKVLAVIVRSLVPGMFCAGADLKERAKLTNEEVTHLVDGLRAMTTHLEQVPVPTIAAIDGFALGGGLEIALACDVRTAASTAKMGLVETTLGIIPGAGGTQRLPRVVGGPVAKELIFTGRIVDGEEAGRLCLVNHVAPQNGVGDAAYQKALQLAEQMVKNGPIALRMAKVAVNNGLEVAVSNGLAVEKACYAQVVPSKDRIEGLTAFKEKRLPVYKGE